MRWKFRIESRQDVCRQFPWPVERDALAARNLVGAMFNAGYRPANEVGREEANPRYTARISLARSAERSACDGPLPSARRSSPPLG